MSNQFTSDWLELYACFVETIGTSPVVSIGGVSSVPCIVGKDGMSAVFALGGFSSKGTQVIQTLTSAWSSRYPVKPDIVTITGLPGSRTITEQVISTEEVQGITYITIGDNSI